MRSVWHSLLWKEWREYRWKLAALVAICVGVPLLAGAVEFEIGNLYLAFSSSIVPYVILAGAFLGINIAAGENSIGTAPFLQSLPAASWHTGLAKLTAAIVTGVIPLMVTAGLVYLLATLSPATWQAYLWEYRGFSNAPRDIVFGRWLLICVGCGSIGVASLIIWVAAAGVNRLDEIRAAATAVLLIAIYVSANALAANAFVTNRDPLGPIPVWYQVLTAAGPTGAAALMEICEIEKAGTTPELEELFVLNYGAIAIAAIFSHGLLGTWYLSQFNRAIRAPRDFDKTATAIKHLRAPWRSPLVAVVWKQFRETGPLVTLGLVCLIVLVAWDIFSSGMYDSAAVRSYLAWVVLDAFAVLGGIVALLIGIGVFAGDLNSGPNTFWRSRPVSTNLWFWTKFLTGLAITVVALGGPMLLALPYHVPTEHPQRDLQPEMIIGFAIHVLLYCGAVVSMSLVRRPFYAAIFAFSIVLFGMVMVEFVVPRLFGRFEFNPWEVLAYSLALSAAITPVAWLAVRNDWNWNR